MRALLDTHILVWWVNGSGSLSRAHRRVLAAAGPDNPLVVSDITLWEIATLHELGRIDFDLPVREWLERAAAPPLVTRMGITPAIAAEVAALPPTFHRDPADRIIVATAKVIGATILTKDERIVDAALVSTL